jgi:predicted alpha/beta superfamily hydrolase
MSTQTIRVIYPNDRGSIALRTEENWDVDLAPVSVKDCVTEFSVETSRPYFYFKPVLVGDGGVQWSRGENYLATSTFDSAAEVYPYFLAETHCSVCELMQPLASPAGIEHRFRVFLPPGYYENTLKQYPVLYMHDGNNLFLKEEAFCGNTWRTDEVLGVLDRINACDGVIVVGIHPKDRMSEYTSPGYEDYGGFLIEKLKPLIDEKYRTRTDAVNTAVMGSSLGGVVSFYLAWQWPEVFGKVACLSSTFGYRDDLIERITAEQKRPIKIYLDSGWPGDNYEPTRAMRDRLIWKGYKLGSELLYFSFPQAKHNETNWAQRSPIPFQFLFGKMPIFARGDQA